MTRSHRIATTIIIVAAGLAAQPAMAADEPKAEARAAAAAKQAYPVSEDTKVCVRETMTGSRVPRRICNTLKDWKAQGVDPFAAD